MSELGAFHGWWVSPKGAPLKAMLQSKLGKCKEDALRLAGDPERHHDRLIEAHVQAALYKELLDGSEKTGLVRQVLDFMNKPQEESE